MSQSAMSIAETAELRMWPPGKKPPRKSELPEVLDPRRVLADQPRLRVSMTPAMAVSCPVPASPIPLTPSSVYAIATSMLRPSLVNVTDRTSRILNGVSSSQETVMLDDTNTPYSGGRVGFFSDWKAQGKNTIPAILAVLHWRISLT